MRNTDTFRQYIWLVDTIRMSRKIELKRIQDLWIEDDLNNRKPLSRVTFYRLRLAIEDMFGIRIECDSQHRYFIGNPETLKDNSTQNWMLQTLTVNNVLIDSLSIKDQLVLEEVPAGMEYLPMIIKALKNNKVLRMGYKKFTDTDGYVTHIKPYCLKMFRQRWYLLGRSERKNDKLAIYALDRFTKLEETDTSFEPDQDFNAENYFKHFFGVFIGEDKEPEHIILRAYGGKMVSLMRTLPKHHSQKEIATKSDYSDFEYNMVPTFDFKQEILKEGPDLEVLEPQSLREEIKTSLTNSLSRFQTY